MTCASTLSLSKAGCGSRFQVKRKYISRWIRNLPHPTLSVSISSPSQIRVFGFRWHMRHPNNRETSHASNMTSLLEFMRWLKYLDYIFAVSILITDPFLKPGTVVELDISDMISCHWVDIHFLNEMSSAFTCEMPPKSNTVLHIT